MRLIYRGESVVFVIINLIKKCLGKNEFSCLCVTAHELWSLCVGQLKPVL
jgi:hypothetical protein